MVTLVLHLFLVLFIFGSDANVAYLGRAFAFRFGFGDCAADLLL